MKLLSWSKVKFSLATDAAFANLTTHPRWVATNSKQAKACYMGCALWVESCELGFSLNLQLVTFSVSLPRVPRLSSHRYQLAEVGTLPKVAVASALKSANMRP